MPVCRHTCSQGGCFHFLLLPVRSQTSGCYASTPMFTLPPFQFHLSLGYKLFFFMNLLMTASSYTLNFNFLFNVSFPLNIEFCENPGAYYIALAGP